MANSLIFFNCLSFNIQHLTFIIRPQAVIPFCLALALSLALSAPYSYPNSYLKIPLCIIDWNKIRRRFDEDTDNGAWEAGISYT